MEGKQIYELMPKIMAQVGALEKDGTNKMQNFKFRSIDALQNKLSKALIENGVFVVPKVLTDSRSTEQTNNGKQTFCTRLKIEYTFYAPDGSSVTCISMGESMDTGDKSTAKAMSMAFKYACFQTLCIPTEDEDPDSVSYDINEAPKQTIGKTKVSENKPVFEPLGGESTPEQRDRFVRLTSAVDFEHKKIFSDEEIKGFKLMRSSKTADEVNSYIQDLAKQRLGK